MKCPICEQGSTKEVEHVMPEDGVPYRAHECMSCSEVYLDMGQLGELADKYRRLKARRRVKFSRWGNSIAVRIPSEVVEQYGLVSGSEGVLTKDKKGLRITPSPR